MDDNLKVGDLAYNYSSGGFTRWYYRRVVVVKLSPKQIVAKDQQGRLLRYWRHTHREVGANTLNQFTMTVPTGAVEVKHLAGRPDPTL